MTKKPQNRKCERCRQAETPKLGGCFSFRLIRNGEWTRGYFHLKCFKAELEKQK